MEDKISDLNFEFFSSTYDTLQILKETNRVRVELVFYKPKQLACVLKVYFSRDLEDVYQRLKHLRHKNLAVIYDVSVHGGNTYIIEEMIAGETLAEQLGNKVHFSEQEVVRMVLELCSGLQMLHSQNPPIIHRDIKPSNVMVREDGNLKLIDFDAARTLRQNVEQDTELLGTKEYASPEHYGYGQTGPASDIYSLGVMMNELLTGQVLSGHQATCKGRLRAVIERCIQVDSKNRFKSVEELSRVLRNDSHWWSTIIRNKWKLAIGAAVLGMIVLGVRLWENGIEKWPNLEEIYTIEASPFTILENEQVEIKLQKLLGIKYSYVMECLGSIDSVEFAEDRYFMSGGVSGLYTIMEAAVSVTQDGEVECGFLEDGICYYYSSDKAGYSGPSNAMLMWLSSHPDNGIEFHENKQYTAPVDIVGTYICTDLPASIIIEKTDAGYKMEGQASYGANIGEVNGSLRQINGHQFAYTENLGGELEPELYVTVYENCLAVKAVGGSFGGMKVSFDGIYRRQGETKKAVETEPEETKPEETSAASDTRELTESTSAGEMKVQETTLADIQPVESVPNPAQDYIPQINTVSQSDGDFTSMIGTTSGIYYMIMEDAYGPRLETSDGKTVGILEYEGKRFGHAVLSYNPYKDEVYLIRTTGSDIWIFLIMDDLSQELKFYEEWNNYDSYGTCGYFSDGVMLCGIGGNILIDTNSWANMGKINTKAHLLVVKDAIYAVGSQITKVNYQGEAEQEYSFSTDGAYAGGFPGSRFFADGDALYYAKQDGFYRFDGEQEEPYLLLKDFRYFTRMDYDYLCITDNGIRYYDYNAGTLKEIRKK